MLSALLTVSTRQWRHHKLRAVITVLSVSVGVAAYFAIQTADETLLRSLESTVDRIAGKATLQITTSGAGFPEGLLDVVRSTEGVADATAVVQDFCQTPLREDAPLLIFGVDIEGEQRLRDYYVEGSDLLKVPRTVVVSSTLAEQEHLGSASALPVLTPNGRVDLVVLSSFKDDRIGALFGGRIGIMDIDSAQEVFGRGQNVDRIDLITETGVSIEEVRERLKLRLPSGLDIERPQTRTQEVEDATLMIRRGFLLTSLVALLISCFLVFNAMSIAVNQRWKEIGILRALGVERRNIRAMFLYDAGLMGLIGSGLGVLAGYYLALYSSRLTAGLSNVLSSTLIAVVVPEPPRFNASFAIQAMVIGVIASIISAWLPSRAASRLNPVLALHNIETRRRETMIGWPRMALGALLVALGLALIRFTTPVLGAMVQLSYIVLIFLGFILMLPRLSCWIAAALRPLADRSFGPEGVLAVDSMILAPRRTSATVGALMAGLAFVFSTWATIQSEKQALTVSFERQINYDLVADGASMTEALVEPISSVPGVKDVDPSTTATTRYRNQIAGIFASDMAAWFARPTNVLEDGDYQRAAELVPQGEAVLISNVFAARWRLGAGDILSLATPNKTLDLPVAGVVDYKAWFEGTVYLDRRVYRECWGDNKVSWFAIDIEPDADPSQIRNEIGRLASAGHPLLVTTAAEVKENGREAIVQTIDQLFSFFYVQMFIATFVAVIGIINTLVISVWDRKREIGIIRAVGGTRRQITRIVLLEAAVIAVIGLIIGAVKGVFDSYFMARTGTGIFGSYSIPVYFPATLILLSVPVVTILAIAAAWWPARLAAKTNVISAIGSE